MKDVGVKERIREFIKSQNISERQFEIKCKLSTGYINNIRKSISPEKIQSISVEYPELNVTWLITGQGEMLSKEDPSNKEDNNLKASNPPNIEADPNSSQWIIKELLDINKKMLEQRERDLDLRERELSAREKDAETIKINAETINSLSRQKTTNAPSEKQVTG